MRACVCIANNKHYHTNQHSTLSTMIMLRPAYMICLFVCCFTAHQQLRSLGPRINVNTVYCHIQDMASQRAFNVPSAHRSYLGQESVSPMAEDSHQSHHTKGRHLAVGVFFSPRHPHGAAYMNMECYYVLSSQQSSSHTNYNLSTWY
jgi:hypothetical protein